MDLNKDSGETKLKKRGRPKKVELAEEQTKLSSNELGKRSIASSARPDQEELLKDVAREAASNEATKAADLPYREAKKDAPQEKPASCLK